MNKTIDISSLLRSLLKDLDKHISAFEKKKGRGSLHHFRVSGKETLTLLRFLRENKRSKGLRDFERDLKRFFKKAGELREAQLHLKWLHRHRKPGVIKHSRLENITGKLTRKIIKEIPELKKSIDRTGKKQSDKLSAFPTKDVRAYQEAIMRDLLISLDAGILPGRWHAARKNIKSIQHIGGWPLAFQARGQVHDRLVNQLDEFQSHVGYWHDIGETIAWISAQKTKSMGHASLQQECEGALIRLEKEYVESYEFVQAKLKLLTNTAKVLLKRDVRKILD